VYSRDLNNLSLPELSGVKRWLSCSAYIRFRFFLRRFFVPKNKKTKNDPVFRPKNKMPKNKKMRLFGTVNEK